MTLKIEQFGKRICDAVKEALGAGYDAEYKEVSKNNGVCLHAVIIGKKGSNVSPAIYIDDLYEDYEEGRTFGDIVYDILCVYRRNAREIRMDMEFFTHFDKVKDRILYKLIHRESNRTLLADIPYIEWNDLALVFYYSFEDTRFGKATILIHNSHLNMWKTTCSELYKNAGANMLRLCPEEMLPINQMISEIVTKNTSKQIRPEDVPEVAMYVLSNRDRLYGASALLYSDSLKTLTGKLNKNLIILPSSVHEVLLVPDDGLTEKDFYKEMVRDVNDTQVDPEERLSYNVYYYDRFSHEISVM
ncbi:MAG: DUF5688 family protein [Butyrivibrio sp.]|nr:DUF5688 family protein [Butyrivibrio sp.]